MNLFTLLADVTSEAGTETVSSVATDTSENASVISWEAVLEKLISWATSTGIKLVIAILIMIISFKIINIVTKRIYKKLVKRQADATLTKVLYNTSRIFLKIIVLICLVGYIGIQTASISAVIASLGVGISLAVQGTLSNFAGGVIIIIMRPFKLGDFITSNGQSGTVEDIKLFYTNIVTPDNKVVMIPNGSLANNVIVNVTAKDTRRVDVIMSVSYDSDIEKAKKIIKDVCKKNKAIFTDPAPFVEVGEYADSSINIYVRAWTKKEEYWNVNFYLLREIKVAFDKNGIEVPFNQIDVHVTQEESKK